MVKNKGFIGLGLIIAIILGIIVVGGGTYYLGKSDTKKEINKQENVTPNNENTGICGNNGEFCPGTPGYEERIKREKQNQLVVDNQQISNPSITVLSPNGGEVYKDTDKVAIKWKGEGKERVTLSLRFFDGEWCFIKDLPSNITNYVFTPYENNCGNGRIINSGKYKVTVIAYDYGGMSPEPGTAFAGDYSDNDGSDTGFSIDSSDDYFTINSERYQNSTELFSKNITCHNDNPNYFVVSKSLGSETGTDILIKYKNSNKNISCDYKVDETDFEIKNNGNAQYFYTINKNLLILDSGTGPSIRGVAIYNLDTRKKVFDDIYSPDGMSNLLVDIKNSTMTYWFPNLKQSITKQNCSLPSTSLSRVIVSHILLDLSTLIKKDLKEDKCVYGQ